MALHYLPSLTNETVIGTTRPAPRDVSALAFSTHHREGPVMMDYPTRNQLPNPSALLPRVPSIQELQEMPVHDAPRKEVERREIDDLKRARQTDHYALQLVLSLVADMVQSRGGLNGTDDTVKNHDEELAKLQAAVGMGHRRQIPDDQPPSLPPDHQDWRQQVEQHLRDHEQDMQHLWMENSKLRDRVSALETENHRLQTLHEGLFSICESTGAMEHDTTQRPRLDEIKRMVFARRGQYVGRSDLASLQNSVPIMKM